MEEVTDGTMSSFEGEMASSRHPTSAPAPAPAMSNNHDQAHNNSELGDGELMNDKFSSDVFTGTKERPEIAATFRQQDSSSLQGNHNDESSYHHSFRENVIHSGSYGETGTIMTEANQHSSSANQGIGDHHQEGIDDDDSFDMNFFSNFREQGGESSVSDQNASSVDQKDEEKNNTAEVETFDKNIFNDEAVEGSSNTGTHQVQVATYSAKPQQATPLTEKVNGQANERNDIDPLRAPLEINPSIQNTILQANLEAVESMYNLRANEGESASMPNIGSNNRQQMNGEISNVNQNGAQRSAECEIIELSDDDDSCAPAAVTSAKRQRIDPPETTSRALQNPAAASSAARNRHMPDWMDGGRPQQPADTFVPSQLQRPMQVASTTMVMPRGIIPERNHQHEPCYRSFSQEFVPSWQVMLPRVQKQEFKSFELSLLNVQEFTITGLPVRYEGPPSSVSGLRKIIKEISKGHGKAVWERDKEGYGGKWRIPLGAYRSFFAYLCSDRMVKVVGIPENQLKIASLGKARLERGFPSKKKIISIGVPRGLASALAPFQRGGVDFVSEKHGRALIADDMGLGKTIQAIAGLTLYHEEWPVLVLTPSSARYHWENEFQQWVGIDSPINKETEHDLDSHDEEENDDKNNENEDEDSFEDVASVEKRNMPLLQDSQIHVLTSSKDDVIPYDSTKVVICSYGLAPALIESGKIYPGQFKCAIVDESHMLKNINTKRTKFLVPVLHATNRCVLLSGTPALARPSELFPQLKILSTEETAWWDNEEEFQEKYVRRSSPARRAELFTMLTGTVMIRRLKVDILKSMPNKIREKAVSDVSTPTQRKEFHQCMTLLREGKGVLGKLARQHSALNNTDDSMGLENDGNAEAPIKSNPNNLIDEKENARAVLMQQYKQQYQERVHALQHTLAATAHQLNPLEQDIFLRERESEVRQELDVWYKERLHELEEEKLELQTPEITRKSALNRMYTLTAKAKVPLIADMVTKWLYDPTKGKLCVFAHHIFVLDELIKLVGLSNAEGSDKKYIRIDGSTSPKHRQAQIKAFQNDSDVMIAVLGITAAGVAVTLTASSTVWFAELFWTPALMIQAEDRCHRIGQNSQVKCLYFVASGTLDDLLWKLLEKKFRDLCEFVEGKEKMKIVVNKIYKGKKELLSMFSRDEDEALNDALDLDDIGGGDEAEDFFDLEKDLEGDISMLAKEELTMMLPDGDDDENDGVVNGMISEPSVPKSTDIAGSTEEDAIALLSDDEDEKPAAVKAVESTGVGQGKGAGSKSAEAGSNVASANSRQPVQPSYSSNFSQTFRSLPQCKFYSILFEGPAYGVQLVLSSGRAIVGKKVDPNYQKPAVGDILVAVNGHHLPPSLKDLHTLTLAMKQSLARGAVELLFAEDEGFKGHFLEGLQLEFLKRRQILKQRQAQSKSSQGPGEVIELLDDD